MKRFVEGSDRGQSTLFPECLEGWICEDNPVRAIDVFIDELAFAELGFGGVDPEATGRPSYHPSVPLKLYISTATSTGFSRAGGLSAKPDATLRCCGSRVGWFPITRQLLISARITGLRSAKCARGLSRFAESLACWRMRVSLSTAASSKRSTRAIRISRARRWSVVSLKSRGAWRGI
jgi:hypothetical protein